uniref:TLC domain-containing protein n=1 Tax=Eutreptiella gymnastica TaxID=73025 RepID=A0A7S4CAC5_9EUGL
METGNLEVNWVWALMMAAPRWEVQLALVLLHALLHKAAQGIVAPAIGRYLDCKPWTQGIIAREIARWEQLIGLTQTPQEARDNYIWWVIVGLCHLVGGLLCVPAVAGVTGDVALPLVRHSILVETGFELVDCLEKGYTRLFHPRGRDIVTNQLAFLVFAHHSTSAALGLPANVYHSDSPLMHEMVLLLQGASAFAILGTQYAMTLNVARVSELRQMQLIASLSCLVIVYTRFVRCLTLSYELLLFFLQKEDTYFVSVGSTCFLLMFVFSAVVLQDTLKRAYKFGTMSAAEAKRRYGAHEK